MNAAVDELLDKPAAASAAPAGTAGTARTAAVASLAAPAALIDEPSIARAMHDAQQADRPVLEVLA